MDPKNDPTQEGPGNGDQELPMRPIRDIKNITRTRAYNEDNFKIISKVIKTLCITQMKFRVESVDFILLYAFKFRFDIAVKLDIRDLKKLIHI